jgi:hypothetical protein
VAEHLQVDAMAVSRQHGGRQQIHGCRAGIDCRRC